MRVEDISLRQVFTHDIKRTIELSVMTKRGESTFISPINKNGIYNIRSLSADEMTKKFLKIKRHFVNQTFDDIKELDHFLHSIDISVDFRELGGNLAFAISSAFLKMFAKWEGVEPHEYLSKGKSTLPSPLFVITDKNETQTDMKEYILYTQQKIFSMAIMKLLYERNNARFDAKMTNEKVLRELAQIARKNSFHMGINFGASDIWNTRRYTYGTGENLTNQEQLLLVQEIVNNNAISYVEDPFHEDEFVLHATLTHRMPTRIVAGNAIYSNNFERFKRGIELKSSSGVSISPARMGTITDVKNFADEAKKNKIATIITGEIDDGLISDIATGMGFDYMKLGTDSASMNRINNLIKIESKL